MGNRYKMILSTLIVCLFLNNLIYTACPRKNPLWIFRTYWMLFSKTVWNSKISCISPRHLKKKLALKII